jgi:FkbM family methyltransferase
MKWTMGLLNRIFGSRAGDGEAAESRDRSPGRENAAARKRDTDVGDRIDEGLRCHQAGDLRSAEHAYRDALDLAPDNAHAHYLLGSLLGAGGHLDAALEHLQQAMRLAPAFAAARSDMGNVLRAQGRLEDAEAAYREAIAIDADLASAHRNLGDLLRQAGRVDEAIDSLAEAASLTSDDAQAHFMLADLLSARGRYREACHSYRAGLVHAPGVAAAHNNLGASLRHLSRDDEALACFQEAVRIDPNLADAHENLARMLEMAGSIERAMEHYRGAAALNRGAVGCRRSLARLLLADGHCEEALQMYREALTLEPDVARSHFDLGNALMEAGHREEAIERFRQAVRLDSADAKAHVNLGFALYEDKQYEAAAGCFRTAVKLDDGLVEAHNNLGGVLQQQGELRPAMRAFERALELAPEQAYVRSNLLTCMNYQTDVRPEDVLEQHRDWAKLLAHDMPSSRAAAIRQPDPERRLRIGYVSADFRFHSVAFFIAPVLEWHDREHFEITCYANVLRPDPNTDRIKAMSDNWRDIASLGDEEAAAYIRRDGVDILVDLSGHTVGNRLPVFAQRPAPVQVTYLGYPNTTGMTAMDYRLTDAWSDPPGQTEHLYSEELVRLDEGFLCFQPFASSPEVRESDTADNGEGVTFASFNELLKLTPQTLTAWCAILERTPGSKLLIKATALEDEGTRHRVRERFTAHGLAPERLKLLGRTQKLEDHLALYLDVDVALDTFPYNGTTTTCEALWMGVPVVTLAGAVHASRVGLSMLSSVGLDDLVAENSESYVKTAVDLATDRARLAELRTELRARMRASQLMNAEGLTRRIESAYREMWRRACNRADGTTVEVSNEEQSISVRTVNDIRVRVPNAVDKLTSYVLLEQEDWFEDEIHFVRRLLKPGMHCLDIGANYGIYTLNCARGVGSAGRVWSVEPTPDISAFLATSIAENGFDHVSLVPIALGRDSGTAKLVTHADSEHNFLTDVGAQADRFEIVDVRRLDDIVSEMEIGDIDFVKLDAEGSEIDILEGGDQFFEQQSPVILFEFKNQEGTNWDLLEAVRGRGYEIFQLVPGLQILVPFERDEVDDYRLNLFACKTERMQLLEEQGLALCSVSKQMTVEAGNALDWLHALCRRPYAGALAAGWLKSASSGEGNPPEALVRGLALYCRSRESSLPMAERFDALRAARETLSQPMGSTAEPARLYSLARAARELGCRKQAVDALTAICEIGESGSRNLEEMPFLAVSERIDRTGRKVCRLVPCLGTGATRKIICVLLVLSG